MPPLMTLRDSNTGLVAAQLETSTSEARYRLVPAVAVSVEPPCIGFLLSSVADIMAVFCGEI
jgi:hypothetical protein